MKLFPLVLSGTLGKLSPFHDDILYDIKWVGENADLDVPGVKYSPDDFVIMKSAKNEEYKCFLPSESDETIAEEQNTGDPAEALLQNLFLPTKAGKQQCSYRLEVRIGQPSELSLKVVDK